MTSLPRFSVNNPVLVNLAMWTILVAGTYCGLTLVREMFPESRPEQVMISTAYPGASPSEVEKGITLKIEEQIKDIDGLEKVTSSITEGHSAVLMEMRSGFTKIDKAVDDAKTAVDRIPREDFPEEALQTQITEAEPRFPVIMVSLYGDIGDRALKTLGQRLKDDLLALPDVTNVTLTGTRKDEISVEVRPDQLVKFGLSFMDVARAIGASNLDLPGGQLRTRDANVAVRTLGERDRGDQLYDIVVRSDPSGRAIRVRDVATIVDGFEDVDSEGRFNGLPAVSCTVYKTAEQDAIAIADGVRALVAGKMGRPLERSGWDRLVARLSGRDKVAEVYDKARSDPYPPGISIATHNDLSRFISDRLDLLKRNGVWGLMLVFVSLLMFLNWRLAFWVMMGLVLAITGALVSMKLLGQTLNLMTMFGLIIVLGMLVDDAIIVSENVYSRIERGESAALAAVTGTEEVTWPVIGAVTTTIVAFVPLMFIEGRMGDWMGVLPIIVCVALCVSLIEALTILPSHLARSLARLSPRRAARTPTNRGWGHRAIARIRGAEQAYLMTCLRSGYERLLRLSTSYRYVTMAGLVTAMIITLGAVMGGHVPFVFIQKIDSEVVIANMKLGVGTPAAVTREAVRSLERASLELPELKSIYSLVGVQLSDDGSTASLQSHVAQVFIELVASDRRSRNSDEITNELRAKTADLPGVEKLKFAALSGGPGGAPIHLEIRGDRIEDLLAVSNLVEDRLAVFDGLFDIQDDFDAGRREVQIELYPGARALGLTTESLATQVRAAFYGFEARKVQRGREDVKIMVRYPADYRRRVYDIESMRVATPSGALVPFTEVARLREGIGFASIKRTDQKRTVTVTADVDENVTNAEQVIGDMRQLFPKIAAQYPGVGLEFGGQKLETQKAFGSLKQGFTAAFLMIYAILAGIFRSYVQPMIVMVVIPFGLIGAVVGHYVMGYPLTILSMIGLVALTGIVVNDSIVLVAFVDQLVRQGADPHEAVLEASKGRLRPILLTSITTVLGMAPLLTETSFQAKFLIPMGISISAGLIFSTVLTLVAVPSLFLVVIDVRAGLTSFGRWMSGRTRTSAPGEGIVAGR